MNNCQFLKQEIKLMIFKTNINKSMNKRQYKVQKMIKNKTRKVLNYFKNKFYKNKINLKKCFNKINKGKNI